MADAAEPATSRQTDQAEPVDFEDVVAALLKVDPQGIIGKDRKKRDSPPDEL